MNAWLNQHLLALRDALRRLAGSPISAVLSLFVIGIALALPVAGWLAIDSIQRIATGSAGRHQISVFLVQDADRKAIEHIESQLKQSAAGQWRFVSRDEALRRLQGEGRLGELATGLPKNPLPDAFVIEPRDTSPAAMESLANSARKWPAVAHVQLDTAWVRRFDAIVGIGKLAVTFLATVFGSGLVVVTFNTIRLQILAHAAEIEVARLIGATDGWIRRPFAYFGALQGFLGALLALGLLKVGYFLLTPRVSELAALYGTDFMLSGLDARICSLLLLSGTLLGWGGALLSVGSSLRRSA